MATPTVIISEGLFWEEDVLRVQEDSGDSFLLEEKLHELIGREVDLLVHHAPPEPPLPHEPGYGCCHWGGHCPSGHQENPTWLFSVRAKGVLSHPEDGMWRVGGTEIPLHRHMLGHRGRVALFAEGEVNEAKPIGDLLAEAEELRSILEGLQQHLKRTS